jgi:RND family efflux transporter MFP subunit
MEKSISTSTASTKGKLFSLNGHPRRMILLVVFFLLVIAGGAVYFVQARQAAAASAEPAYQTAAVRQGDLIISASGTGTLVASDERELAFSVSGQVTGVFVQPGDYVEAGMLLAQIDSQQAQTDYSQAKHAYQELTSAAGIASAQEAVAQAQADLMSAKYELEYLISPDVMYWEVEIKKAEETLQQAKAVADASPSDQDTQQALKKAKEYLNFAQGKLDEAWNLYYDEYVPETFRLAEYANGNDYYIIPSDLEIKVARTAIEKAQSALNDSQEYYAVLTGSPMPEDASSEALIQLQQAERDLQTAQANLDGTKIYAPISGTVMEVNATVGDTIDTSTAVVVADLTQLDVEIYLDESDWDKVAVGKAAEVTFSSLPDQIFTGSVTEVDNELYVSFNTSTVRGLVSFDSWSDEIDLPVGASASVEVISARAENAVLVPLEALFETSSGQYAVYVLENNEPTERVIEIGLQDQIYAEVRSGLEPGETVITDFAAVIDVENNR